jgi:hypothetical protein
MSTFLRLLLQAAVHYGRTFVFRAYLTRFSAWARQILVEGGLLVLAEVRESGVRRIAGCVQFFSLPCFADATLV